MEWEMGLAVLGVVAVTAAAVYLVSVMGIKEKSFEEAIAEQKKRSEDLLGRKESKKKAPVKDKSKKQKKAKEKEKHQVPSSSSYAEVDAVDNQTSHHHHGEGVKHHVEIDPEPEFLDDDTISESRRASVVRMKDVIKPILVNKEEHSPVVEQNDIVEPANHFEVIHPKDDLELRKHVNYDDSSPPSTPPPPLPQRNLKKSNHKKQPPLPPKQQVLVQEEIGNGDSLISETNVSGYYENVPVIDEQLQFTDVGQGDILKGGDGLRNRKTKQREQQDQLTAAKLESTIEKVSLSSSEIQNLIDILLNKQHAGDSEWINKGKSDSVGNLKKTLAERERQLNEEQVTVQTLQSKLKDLRFEFTAEKTKFSQIRRQLEDASNQKMQDVQQLTNQLSRIRQEAGVEKQQLQQKLQQMQISLGALRDENTAVKSALNVEQSNRGKADSLEREAEALRTQCGHLENQLKAAFQSNQELSNQSRNLQEHLRVLEERKKQEEHNIHAQYAQQAQQIQEREAHLLSEIKKFQDLLAEGEKERISLRQQNTNLQNSIRNSQEQAITLDEVTKKMEELREAEKNHRNLLEDSANQVASLKSQLQGSDSKVKSLEEERKNLLDQISSLAAEKEREKLNGDIQSADQETANANKTRLAELEKTLSEKEGQITELNKATSQYKVDIDKSLQDLKNQREKNDELRQKNTKLMDTLSVTEKNLEVRVTQCELLVQEERTKVKSTLLKYFPQIKSDLSNPDWVDTFSKSIQEEMNKAQPTSANNDSKISLELKNLQEVNSRLQEEVTHYQNVLSSTETLLSNLQSSIEKEERKWHQKLQQKDAELKAALGQSPSVNVDLKTQLDGEREEKSVLLERCSELENNIQNLKKQLEQVDTLRNQLEKLDEEVRQERQRGTELSTEKSRLESEVIKHQESCKVEQTRVTQLQSELESLRKQVSLDDSVNSAIISSNGVVNGKSVDGSEPVVKTPASPQHASSSTATSPPVTPNTSATNADLPITSKDKDTKEKKKKKGAGRKDKF